MMTTDDAQQQWSTYSGKNYIYNSGKFQGKVTKAKGWELRGGVMFIEMSDGQLIDQRNFSNILSQTNKQVHIPEEGVTQDEFYGEAAGGETPIKENNIPISKKYRIDELDKSQESKFTEPLNVNSSKYTQSQSINPIHTILEKAPTSEITNIPIEIKINLVTDDVIKLLEITFPDDAFKETIYFYKDKINIESIQNSIESSLAKYLSTKFNNVSEEDLSTFEDGVEGKIIEE